MEHDKIADNDLIDKYLLHQLTDTEENELEEHLLFCNECKKTLEIRKASIEIIRETNIKNYYEEELGVKKINDSQKWKIRILRIAASITILLSIGWIVGQLLETNTEKKIADFYPIIDSTLIQKKVNHQDSSTIEKSDFLAKNFQELPMMENFIKYTLRAEQVTVVTPKIGQIYHKDNAFFINWTFHGLDSLNFVVFNNKSKLLFEKKIAKNFEFKHKLKNGLYYWQLETEEEALYTGKFLIK